MQPQLFDFLEIFKSNSKYNFIEVLKTKLNPFGFVIAVLEIGLKTM